MAKPTKSKAKPAPTKSAAKPAKAAAVKPAAKIAPGAAKSAKATATKPAPTKAIKSSAALKSSAKTTKPASKPAPKAAEKPRPKAPAAPAKPVAAKPVPAKPAPAKAVPPKAPAPVAIPESIASPPIAPPLLDAAGNPVLGENRPRPRGGLSSMGKGKKPKIKKPELVMPKFDSVFKPGARKVAPLIPSGPKNPPAFTGPGVLKEGEKFKPVFNKRDLDKYRQILVRKRAEVAGDVQSMEAEALNASGGGASHTPQHVAEQGSDTFDQDNSLRLAQKERELIKEIDEAIKRIDNGTYGICEVTRKPIDLERLAELPATRYSIEGARIVERQRMIPGGASR